MGLNALTSFPVSCGDEDHGQRGAERLHCRVLRSVELHVTAWLCFARNARVGPIALDGSRRLSGMSFDGGSARADFLGQGDEWVEMVQDRLGSVVAEIERGRRAEVAVDKGAQGLA